MSKTLVALLQDSSKTTADENCRKVQAAKDNFNGQLKQTDIKAKPRKVQWMVLKEAYIAEEVLL